MRMQWNLIQSMLSDHEDCILIVTHSIAREMHEQVPGALAMSRPGDGRRTDMTLPANAAIFDTHGDGPATS